MRGLEKTGFLEKTLATFQEHHNRDGCKSKNEHETNLAVEPVKYSFSKLLVEIKLIISNLKYVLSSSAMLR